MTKKNLKLEEELDLYSYLRGKEDATREIREEANPAWTIIVQCEDVACSSCGLKHRNDRYVKFKDWLGDKIMEFLQKQKAQK